MRWLTNKRGRLSGSNRERGATATIFAILFSGLMIIGMLAISVDLGNLTYERRQLQNAADATALALAAECAGDLSAGQPSCDPQEVEDLLDANSHDGLSRYEDRPGIPGGACARPGVTLTGNLPLCPSTGAIDDLRECPPVPPWLQALTAVPYVETYAATDTATNGDKLFLPFSRVLAGGASGDAGTSACARAAWGAPSSYSADAPFTISSCEWKKQTVNGTTWVDDRPEGPAPGYGGAGQPAWPAPGREVVIQLHDPGDESSDCDWRGKDTGGGFGWLDSGGDCQATITSDDWVHVDVGKSATNPCKAKIASTLHSIIEFPVFDCVIASPAATAPVGPIPSTANCDPTNPETRGNNTWYHIAGWAKFYVTGFRFPGFNSGPNVMPGGYTCSGSQACITGWYLTGQLSESAEISGPPDPGNNFGTYVVTAAG